jgi:hypothetical protein
MKRLSFPLVLMVLGCSSVLVGAGTYVRLRQNLIRAGQLDRMKSTGTSHVRVINNTNRFNRYQPYCPRGPIFIVTTSRGPGAKVELRQAQTQLKAYVPFIVACLVIGGGAIPLSTVLYFLQKRSGADAWKDEVKTEENEENARFRTVGFGILLVFAGVGCYFWFAHLENEGGPIRTHPLITYAYSLLGKWGALGLLGGLGLLLTAVGVKGVLASATSFQDDGHGHDSEAKQDA